MRVKYSKLTYIPCDSEPVLLANPSPWSNEQMETLLTEGSRACVYNPAHHQIPSQKKITFLANSCILLLTHPQAGFRKTILPLKIFQSSFPLGQSSIK